MTYVPLSPSEMVTTPDSWLKSKSVRVRGILAPRLDVILEVAEELVRGAVEGDVRRGVGGHRARAGEGGGTLGAGDARAAVGTRGRATVDGREGGTAGGDPAEVAGRRARGGSASAQSHALAAPATNHPEARRARCARMAAPVGVRPGKEGRRLVHSGIRTFVGSGRARHRHVTSRRKIRDVSTCRAFSHHPSSVSRADAAMIRVPYHQHQQHAVGAVNYDPQRSLARSRHSFVHHQRSGGSGLSGGGMRGTCALRRARRRASKITWLGRQRDRLETFAVRRKRSLRRTRRPDVRYHVRPRLYPRPRSRPRPHLYPRPGVVPTGFVDENLRKLLLLVAHVRVRPRLRLANPRATHAARRRSDHRRDDSRDDVPEHASRLVASRAEPRPRPTRRSPPARTRARQVPGARRRRRSAAKRRRRGSKQDRVRSPRARRWKRRRCYRTRGRRGRPVPARRRRPRRRRRRRRAIRTSRAPSRRNAGPRAANTARISTATLSYPCVPRYVPIFSPHAE